MIRCRPEALAAGPLQVFHKKNCNCEVTEHYISKISGRRKLNDYVTGKGVFGGIAIGEIAFFKRDSGVVQRKSRRSAG